MLRLSASVVKLMDIVLLRFLLPLVLSLQAVKADVSTENKIQIFIPLVYEKGVGLFGNVVLRVSG